jgi:phosphate transport system permease protein
MSEDYEPKFSLIPLIFGTIKAAFYSLLFAIPIAILGAIYTSEFVNLKVRAIVKPTMEMMASLPSVVLGFVAALVMAPVVETWIAAVLLVFIVVPVSLMVAAYLWQMIPLRIALRIQGSPKFFATVLVVVSAIYGAVKLGDWFEGVFFMGDFRAWVNGDVGGPEPMLFLLALPLSFIVISVFVSRFYGRAFALVMKRMSQFRAALLEMGRWVGSALLAVLCSLAIAKILALLGLDVRGTFVDTYVQRNTLIVGFAMGFAVIPIIYTIAEDALNAVPEHLRAASLGCGATPWQTAIYVVLPTAVSGVFSAIMIGMGRAVGETMIVVMATGNTPIIDMNIFNGLRALSATIAVELPEAVKDGTLYRILFLSGLVLFAMTFVINTVAEVIRLRFRKRAMQL